MAIPLTPNEKFKAAGIVLYVQGFSDPQLNTAFAKQVLAYVDVFHVHNPLQAMYDFISWAEKNGSPQKEICAIILEDMSAVENKKIKPSTFKFLGIDGRKEVVEMAAHTPTPWVVRHFQDGADEIQTYCSGETPVRVAIMEGFVLKPATQKGNAIFIVTACNAYDELLKALKDLLADIEWNKSTIEPGTFGEKLIREAQSAIAKAEGRPTGIADRRAEINYRITEDKLTDAIFNNSPLDAEGSGTKAEARAQAREMLK